MRIAQAVQKLESMRHQTATSQQAQPSTPIKSGVLQRKCVCGQHTIAGGECEACSKKREGMLQRKAADSAKVDEYIKKTVSSVTARWNTYELHTFHSELRRPKWKLNWPIQPPSAIRVNDLP